jgi:hypothetical protein
MPRRKLKDNNGLDLGQVITKGSKWKGIRIVNTRELCLGLAMLYPWVPLSQC